MSKKKTVTPAKPVKVVVKKDYTRLWEILVILLVCFAVYGNSIRNGYNLDDAYVVSLDETNPHTAKGIKGIPEILTSPYNVGEGVTYGYRPLGKVTMAIEYSLWGNNPHYSHVVNILLYALNIFLLLLFIRKIAALFNYKNEFVIYASLLLFALHPIHTEVVNSIKNREEILCFIFMLSALLLFFKYYEEKKHILILPIVVLTVLAFLSKQTAINIFGIIGLYIVFSDGQKIFDFVKKACTFIWSCLTQYKLPVLFATKHFVVPLFLLLLFSIAFTQIFRSLTLHDTFAVVCAVTLLVWAVYRWTAARQDPGEFKVNNLYKPALCILWLSVNFFVLLNSTMVGDSLMQLTLQILLLNYIPVIIAYSIYLLFSRKISLPRLPKYTLPLLSVLFLFIMLGYVAFMIVEKAPLQVQEEYFAERIEQAYEQDPYAFDLAGKGTFPTGMQTLFFYLKKLAIPFPLGFYYGYNMFPVQGWDSVYPYLGILLGLLIIGLLVLSIWRTGYRFPVFWILLLLLSIFPFLNLVEKHFVTGIVGERLAYQASIGYCVLLAFVLSFLSGKLAALGKWPVVKTGSIFLALVCLPYFALTVSRNAKWVDNTTLFQNDIAYLSNSARANFMVASNYMLSLNEAGRGIEERNVYLSNANTYLDRALEIYPRYDAVLLAKGLLYFEHFRQTDSAMVYLDSVSERRTIDYVRAQELMGDISYLAYEDRHAAYAYYSRGYMLRKQSLELYNKLMQVLFELEDFERVKSYAELGIKQGWQQSYIDRADANFYTNDLIAAIGDYEKALMSGIRTDALVDKLVASYRQTGDTAKFVWLREVLSK